MQEVFFAFTPEGKILQWNRRLKEVTGYSDDEIAQMHPADFVPPDETDLVRRHIERVLDEGRTRLEAHYQTKEGRRIPYEFTGSLFEQEDQLLICGTGRDISKRKRTKEKLEASEERYRRLFEDVREGIAITTPEGEIIDVNPAAQEIFGYSREELLSMNAADLYVDSEEREELAAALREQGEFAAREIHCRRADGEEIVCEISGTLQHEEEDAPTRWLGLFRDVTQRKEAEEALRESEETFRKLAEGALVGIGLIQDGVYEYVNPALEEMTGYDREELLGESPKFFVHPDDWPKVHEKVRKREEGDIEDVRYETRITTKAGATRIVEISGTRITHQGAPAVIGTIQDITERRQMERQILRVQEEERRRLGRDLHDGVASLLTGAVLKLNLLSRMTDEEEINERIDETQALIEKGAADVRRLSRGLNPSGLSDGDLPSALRELAENTEGGQFERSDDLPPFDAETATHLYRIAQEAVMNARRYADSSTVVVRLVQEENEVVLGVEDDGTGFDLEDADGEGLGFRSMRHRAEFLGAELNIESTVGEGTRISCRVPA